MKQKMLIDLLEENRNSNVKIMVMKENALDIYSIRWNDATHTFHYYCINEEYGPPITISEDLFKTPAENCAVVKINTEFDIGDRVVFDKCTLYQNISFTKNKGNPLPSFLMKQTAERAIGKIVNGTIGDDDGCLYYVIDIPDFNCNLTIGESIMHDLCSKISD